ncbi:MAG: hypothetical protein RR787_02640, partial [Hydrogenoanaerobacterium sp.]
ASAEAAAREWINIIGLEKNADTFLKDVGTRRLRRIISHAPLVEGLKLLCAAGIGAALTLAVVLL